jgi:hypothetical protein
MACLGFIVALVLAAVAHCPQVLENTFDHAVSRPVSAALSRPDSVKVSTGGMRLSVRTAARRDPCFQHPAHPLPLENGAAGGPSSLITEPETMTTPTAGKPGTTAAPGSYIPSHYLRRLARSIVLRAALRGRISWHAALPLLSSINGREG